MKSQILIGAGILVSFLLIGTIVVGQQQQENDFATELLKGAGVEMNVAPDKYGDEFANQIIHLLVTRDQMASLTPFTGKAQSILFDYGDKGKLLSLQENSDRSLNGVNIIVSVDTVEGTKLRHKITVGTDRSSWELIKKVSDYPKEPFSRSYVFVQRRGESGRMEGSSYYEGSIIQIDYFGNVDDKAITVMESVISSIAKRHPEVYDMYLKEISEGPILKDNPIITRPDLPDPDQEEII